MPLDATLNPHVIKPQHLDIGLFSGMFSFGQGRSGRSRVFSLLTVQEEEMSCRSQFHVLSPLSNPPFSSRWSPGACLTVVVDSQFFTIPRGLTLAFRSHIALGLQP